MRWLFREKFKVNEDKSKIELPRLTYKEKCKKWDTKIASGFGLFAFLTLVGLVIFNMFHANSSSCGYGLSHSKNMTQYSNRDQKQCALQYECHFQCKDITEDELSVADYLNEELQNHNCKSKITLAIVQTAFKQSKLTKGWLKGLKVEVTKLEIEKCTLHEIGDSAFAEYPFVNLQRLRIIDAEINILQKHSFLGLDSLNDFSFCNYNSPKPLTIEKGVLEGMRETLAILELSQYKFSADDIINLVGQEAPYLPKLSTVVLAYNSIRELKGYSFNKATKLEQLFLHGSGIEKIDENTFSGQSYVRLVNLSRNTLETLPNGTFNELATRYGGIELWDNRWKCNCSLEWLKEYYMQTIYINKSRPPLCSEDNKPFNEVDFCPKSPSTSASTESSFSSSVTESSFTSSSTEAKSNPLTSTTGIGTVPTYTTVKCQERKISNSLPNYDITHSVEVVIQDGNLKLQFHELEGNPLKIEVTTTEDLAGYDLLWFNADSKNETGCRSPVENRMILDDLKRNTTYSFSLLYDKEPQVSPNCTFCIRTEPEWKYRSWITNNYQILVIALSSGIGLLLIFLTALFTFLCIRHHPKIISGNKSVIIVKKKKHSVEDVPPREYERPAYWEPYLAQSSQGYLTPKYPRYAKVKNRPSLRRSFSEWSFASTSNVYNYDDPRQLQAFKMLRPLRQDQRGITEAGGYDYRPPLPPPNPVPKRPSVLPEEDLYSSL